MFDRITRDPAMMTGEPCIRGMRMPVATILRMVGSGLSFDQILALHPLLEREDLIQALSYAALAIQRISTRPPALFPNMDPD